MKSCTRADNGQKSKVFNVCFLTFLLFFFTNTTLIAKTYDRHLNGSYTQNSDSKAKTGLNEYELTDFSQTTDVHITDVGNPLRFEALKILVSKDPLKYWDLGIVLKIIPAVSRKAGIYTGWIWESVIQSINDVHLEENLDFHISTGDHGDTGLTQELEWFVDIADGVKPENFENHTDTDGVSTLGLDKPEGLMMPWYANIGNHDSEYMGSFNSEGFMGFLVKKIAYGGDPAALNDINGIINTYASSTTAETTSPAGHGFSGMKTHGYYSFNPKPYIHVISLNTSYFYGEKTGLPLETFAQGVLDMNQYNWLIKELENNQDKLCILTSHHSPHSFFPVLDSSKYYISTNRIKDRLLKYSNVIAWIDGHTHTNKIRAETGNGNGYWDITTSGIADYPQEWRRITVTDNGNGTGVLSCRMISHDDVFTSSDDKRYSKGTNVLNLALLEIAALIHIGNPEDRDANLYFKIPAKVAANIKECYKKAVEDKTSTTPETTQETPAEASDSSSGGSNCFISSAAV